MSSKKKKSPSETDLALSVLHHSLPVGTRAVLECQCTEAERAILDYALVQDAARLTALAETTVRSWVTRGVLPSIKWHGGKTLVRITDVRRLKMDRPARGRPLKKKIKT